MGINGSENLDEQPLQLELGPSAQITFDTRTEEVHTPGISAYTILADGIRIGFIQINDNKPKNNRLHVQFDKPGTEDQKKLVVAAFEQTEQ